MFSDVGQKVAANPLQRHIILKLTVARTLALGLMPAPRRAVIACSPRLPVSRHML